MRIQGLSVAYLVSIFLANFHPAGAAAEHFQREKKCHGIDVSIRWQDGLTNVSSAELCGYVRRSLEKMSECGLSLRRALTIEVVDEVKHPCGLPVVGKFTAENYSIQVSSPSLCAEASKTEPGLAKIPQTYIHGSIVVHEVAHAVFWEETKQRQLPAIAHEYFAYAFQIDSLPEQYRETFLEAYPRAAPTDLGPFNFTYLQISPPGFAANAYRHLASQENRCTFINKIISGAAEFPDWEEYE